MRLIERPRLNFWRAVFYLIVACGGVFTVIRYWKGLGAVTNLSDAYPWGLWKCFNVLCGIGLAAGGFTLAGTVHILNVKRFKPILRSAILTAFLGYSQAVVALIYDIGRPWTIWHPIVMWNPHSVLFEVAWCVILYTIVLSLEFSEVVLEKLGWERAMKVQHALLVPAVVFGVVLSTLHQSSLGALFLIVPGKLHSLWYSPRLPLQFFISSVCMGLAMVIVESRLLARRQGRTLDMSILSDLGRVLYAVLGVYAVLRFYDLWDRGALPAIASVEYEPVMLQLELALGVILPLALLATAHLRAHRTWLYTSALLVVGGFVANRLNVSITGIESAQGGHYVPSWPEVSLSLLMVALGFGAFSLAATYLDLYPQPRRGASRLEREAGGAPLGRPRPRLVPAAEQTLEGRGRAASG